MSERVEDPATTTTTNGANNPVPVTGAAQDVSLQVVDESCAPTHIVTQQVTPTEPTTTTVGATADANAAAVAAVAVTANESTVPAANPNPVSTAIPNQVGLVQVANPSPPPPAVVQPAVGIISVAAPINTGTAPVGMTQVPAPTSVVAPYTAIVSPPATVIHGSTSQTCVPTGTTVASPQDLPFEVKGAPSPKKKRLCRYPGCIRVIKSQGHCQRHGAKAKRCKVDGCDKQAQGTHDGMCKRHWKAVHFPEAPPKAEAQPPAPEGESVYDSILPMSIAYRPNLANKPKKDSDDSAPPKADPLDPPPAPEGTSVMPLVSFLKEGADKEAGWHRNAERRARGMYPVSSLSSQLEPWERQLALVEILLLSGGTPYANFKDLAHGWGREKGFHHVLANSVCERRGEVERKRRSDAGRTMTADQREAFRQKLKKSRMSKDGNNKTTTEGPPPLVPTEETPVPKTGPDIIPIARPPGLAEV